MNHANTMSTTQQVKYERRKKPIGKSSVRQQGQECLQGVKRKKVTQNYAKYQYVKYNYNTIQTGFTIKNIDSDCRRKTQKLR